MGDLIASLAHRIALESLVPDACCPGEHHVAYTARHSVLDRSVRLLVAPIPEMQAARRTASLLHPVLLPVYEYGEANDRLAFLVTLDGAPFRRIAKSMPARSLPLDLSAAAQVAGAIGRAAASGILRPELAYSDLLFLPGGNFLLDGVLDWRLSPVQEAVAHGVEITRRLLVEIVDFHAADRGALGALLRHSYPHPGQIEADVLAYLSGRRMRAHRNHAARIRRLGHAHPAFAATGLGLILLGAAIAFFVRSEESLRWTRAEHAGDVAREQARQAQEEALLDATTLLRQVDELDSRRRDLLERIDERYHTIESTDLDPLERLLASRLRSTDGEIESMVRAVKGRIASIVDLDLADRGRDILWRLETAQVEYAFSRAECEERKILSSRTLEILRATRPIYDAVSAGDMEKADAAARSLAEDHPYRDAAKMLVRSILSFPDRRSEFEPWLDALWARGTLTLSPMPGGGVATLRQVRIDPSGQWALLPAKALRPCTSICLPSGEYLVEVERAGDTFRFPILLCRSGVRFVDASSIPDELPPGFIWIAPAAFYCGGASSGSVSSSRYRVCRSVTEPFLIARTKTSAKAYLDWLRQLPAETVSPHIPAIGLLSHSRRLLDERLQVRPELRAFCEDRLPICGISYPSALAFCSAVSLGEKWECIVPRADQWELAARGVAGRLYPWGDQPVKSPIEALHRVYQADVVDGPTHDNSISGVVGASSGPLEWTCTPGQIHGMLRFKGAFWAAPSRSLAESGSAPPSVRERHLGFRCAAIPASQ